MPARRYTAAVSLPTTRAASSVPSSTGAAAGARAVSSSASRPPDASQMPPPGPAAMDAVESTGPGSGRVRPAPVDSTVSGRRQPAASASSAGSSGRRRRTPGPGLAARFINPYLRRKPRRRGAPARPIATGVPPAALRRPAPRRRPMRARPLPLLLALLALALLALAPPLMAQDAASPRPRAREMGVAPGVLPTGPLNAITDVPGVRVGQVTLREGDSVRTGVTAVLPHGGNLFADKVPGAVFVGNGFGKLMGVTQVRELGEIETPVVLTCTLCVPRAADAVLDHVLAQNPEARSVNAVVGETNDGTLNDIRARPVRAEHVLRAIREAGSGPVEEGAVGAGTGTLAFGWKGGIGTSSRALPGSLGGYTVGVLVQSNYGGILQVLGAPVGRELDRYFLKQELDRGDADGSIMIVVATDAPLEPRNLERLAARAMVGLGRTGAAMSNGSGDYAIAFSTAEGVRRTPQRRGALHAVETLPNDLLSPLFQAAAEATEEAIYNSLFRATTTRGYRGTGEALPLDRVREILERYGALGQDRRLPPGRPKR